MFIFTYIQVILPLNSYYIKGEKIPASCKRKEMQRLRLYNWYYPQLYNKHTFSCHKTSYNLQTYGNLNFRKCV